MLGADVGTSLMVMLFSLDLSWLSPLLIFVGVVLFLTRQSTDLGRFGRIMIGLGLIILALQWIMLSAKPVTQAVGVKVIFASLTGDILLDMLVAAMFAIIAYSSLAVVLLVAALSASHLIGIHVALGLVLGANLGSGVLAMLNTLRSPPEARRVTLGNFLFKVIGCAAVAPLMMYIEPLLAGLGDEARQGRRLPSVVQHGHRRGVPVPDRADRPCRRAAVAFASRQREPIQATPSRCIGAGHAVAGDVLCGARGAAHR
jgi:phosphate:Na+ symporter